MTFFDRIGKAFDALPDVGEARSGIGAAWQWANEERDPDSWLQKPANAISAGTSWFTQPVKGAAGEVGEALSTAYSYGIARPLSTGGQMAVNGGIFAPDAWNQAWNRSEEISPGQALATATGGAIAAIPDGRDPRPEFMRTDDPFSKENAKEREKWFHHTWSGKLASGSIDLFLNFGADPTAAVGKGLKAVGKANTVVKASERSTLLEGGVRGFGGGDGTVRSEKKIRRTGDLIIRIQQTPVHELPAMPELRDNADAGALAVMFQRAKELYPDENVPKRPEGRERVISVDKRYIPETGADNQQRQAIADILGTAWGDQKSMDRLVTQREELAVEMERISSAPLPTKANVEYSFDDNGQGALDLFDRQSQRGIQTRQNQIQDEIDRLTRVITPGGQQPVNRIGAGLIERAQQRRAVNSINESWINTGLAGQPARVVAGAVGTRIPGHINIKDASTGYDDLVNVVALMDNTPSEMKQDLMTRFLKANTQNERMNVVDMTRRQIVLDAAKKYNLGEDKARELIAKGDGRMEAIRSTLKQRLYSAADDEDYVTLADPDEDIMNIFHKPLLRSQLEEMHPIIDPREMDKALKAATGSRLLDHLGSTDIAVGNKIGSLVDLAAEGLLIATKRWKDTALMRVAYPLRIQTDSQLRQMVHMETMQYLGTRWTGAKGVRKYLMTDKDIPGTFSFKNVFKTGDYEEALREMLSRDIGDSRFNLGADDIAEIARTIASRDGGMADLAAEVNNRILSKRRSGDWAITQPNAPDWIDKYVRVVNRQIKNSPTAMAALANDNIDHLVKLTRTNPAIRAEYREVGVHYENVETYLQKVIENNNHYLPHPELRRRLLGKDKPGTFVPQMVRKAFSGDEALARPMPVHGEGFSVVEQGKIQARYNKIREGFYNLAAEMPETVLARAPLFWDAYRKRIAASIENLSEDQIDSLTIDAIRKNAMAGARKDVGKVLFDASHASNMSSTMRFLSPFFSAWEDTMSKWSTLMYDNPQIPVRILKLTESPNDAGVVTDSEGNRVDARGRVFDGEGNRITDPEYRGRDQYIMLPKVFGKVFPGSGPVKVRKDSINSVFQGEPWWLPGFGPLVQVPANSIVLKAFPEHVDDPILKYILPYGTTTDSPTTQLLPKWAKAAQNSFGTSQDFANQEGIFLAEATIDARNGGPAVDLDKIHRKTKNFFILKAFTDNASPVSMVPDSKYQLYIDKAHQYAADKTRTDWKKDFFADFPGYAEMAISLSANETGIAATTDAYKGIQKYRKDIQADPENGWFFLGPANHAAQFNGGVYDWQMTNEAGRGKNFRGRKDPAVALEQLQVERGWNTWNSFETQVDQELERRGLVSTRQKGAEDLAWAKEQAQKQLGDYNPAWADARRQVELGKADALIKTGLEFMEKHPSERTRPDMVALQQWIDFRIEVKQALDLRPNKSLAYNPDLQSALEWGASQLKRNNYGFETMYNRVLQYDNLQGMDPADAPQSAQP